jgi:hypothetical protein
VPLTQYSLSPEEHEAYQKNGFLILRKVFSSTEMQALNAESERLLTERKDLIHPRNLRCRYMPHYQTGESLFEVFDPINDISPLCEQITHDARIMGYLESIYGGPASLFKEKLIFKPAGAKGYQLHQDIPAYWPGFPKSFVTILIPLDSCSPENGCTEVFKGYHHSHLSTSPQDYMLPEDIVDQSRKVNLILEPGDIAFFHGLTPHRSEPNKTSGMRRTFYVSYNALSEGGDQRTHHYQEFRQRMTQHLMSQSSEPVYFA